MFGEEVHADKVESVQSIQNVPLLKAALHSDPNPSKGGGDIIVEGNALVPESGPAVSDNCNVNDNEGIYLYEVREGENLSNIAQAFCISTKTILWANEIKDADLIRPGDELVILPITGVNHVVKSGDTLASIAKKYGSEIEDLDPFIADIAAYNQLVGQELTVGQTLIIPGGELAPPPAPAPSQTRVATAPTYTSSAPATSGYFGHPVRGGAIKTQGIHGYNGVDFAAGAGSEIVAAASGQVIVARGSGWNGGYGQYVVVKHDNGTQTLYAHLSGVAVRMGQSVSRGQTLGYMGSTGRSTGVHLHFEVRGATNPF